MNEPARRKLDARLLNELHKLVRCSWCKAPISRRSRPFVSGSPETGEGRAWHPKCFKLWRHHEARQLVLILR
jgi:hypothetical protein